MKKLRKRFFHPRTGRGAAGVLISLWIVVLLLGGCENNPSANEIAAKAKSLWEIGQYADAARHFATLAEYYPKHALAEESLFWAASLHQHFLNQPQEAIRFYQQIIVLYPDGLYSLEAKENLALLYEMEKPTRHRALQVYQQLLHEDALKARQDFFQYKIAEINILMGVMDQGRYEFRELITKFPQSPQLPEAYYLIGQSYFIEKRYPLALIAFRQILKDFPEKPIANRAQFFIAETLEEQGSLKLALQAFLSLKGKYHNEKILEKRISAVQARLKKGIR